MSSPSHPGALIDTWTRTTSLVFSSVLEANRAALAAFGVPTDDTQPSTERIEPASDLPGWEATLTEDDREALGVGDRVAFTKTLSEADVKGFAAASGDTNPVHLDDEVAAETRFQGRIAHGTLVSGLISAALARLPGLVIYLSQDVEFQAPVRIGDRVTAECEIVEDLGNDQYRLDTRILDGDRTVIDGEAVVLIDEPPAED